MIWIVSCKLVSTESDLKYRAEFIQEITQTMPTPWQKKSCIPLSPPVEFYQCATPKGEHGLFITAHINTEVHPILQHVLTKKKALVAINSCALNNQERTRCLATIKAQNAQSELYYAKQSKGPCGYDVNYFDDAGAFGFLTTLSEKELFQNRNLGPAKAIRTVFEKVVS